MRVGAPVNDVQRRRLGAETREIVMEFVNGAGRMANQDRRTDYDMEAVADLGERNNV